MKEIDSGFVRSPVEEYDVCRNCIPCAPHTWIANSKKKIKASDPILKKKTSVEPIGQRGPFLTSTYVDCFSPQQALLVSCFLDLPFKPTGEHNY